MKKLAIFLTLFLWCVNADAAARFWVGGTGSFSDNTNHWAETSNGAPGASKPGSGDTATWDGSSGGGTCTFDEAVDVTSITMGAFTGTIDSNDQEITVQTFSNAGSATRTLDLGNSTFIITGSGTVWSSGTVTNFTFICGTSTVRFTGASPAISVSSAGGTNARVFNIMEFTGSGTATLTSNGSFSFQTLTRTGTAVKTDSFVSNVGGFSVAVALNLAGNSATNRILVRSETHGTARTITLGGSAIFRTATTQHVDFRDITVTGGAANERDLSAITGNSGDSLGNTGITFTTPATQTYTGGTGSWSDITKWTSRVPLPQDTADMSGVTGGTITADMPRLAKDINWTGASGTPAWAVSGLTAANATIYGSLTTIAAMTNTNVNTDFIFEGRGSSTLTTNGLAFEDDVQINMVGGTLTLGSAFSTGGSGDDLTLNNGTFVDSGFSVTVNAFSSSGTNTRAVTRTGTWTMTGTGTVYTHATATGLTLTDTGTIVISDTSASSKTFAGGGLNYGGIAITGGGSGQVIFTGSNTFANLPQVTGGTKTIHFTAATTTTFTGGTSFGNGTNLVTIASATAATHTLSMASGVVSATNLNLTNSIATGGAVWRAFDSTNVSGNTGWVFPKRVIIAS